MGRKAIRETTWGKQNGAENARGGEKDEGAAGHGSSLCEEWFFPPVAGNAFLLLRETLFPAVGSGSLLPSGGKCIKIETKQIRDGEEVRR